MTHISEVNYTQWYHGSNASFDQFEVCEQRVWARAESFNQHKGLFFITDNPILAMEYALVNESEGLNPLGYLYEISVNTDEDWIFESKPRDIHVYNSDIDFAIQSNQIALIQKTADVISDDAQRNAIYDFIKKNGLLNDDDFEMYKEQLENHTYSIMVAGGEQIDDFTIVKNTSLIVS